MSSAPIGLIIAREAPKRARPKVWRVRRTECAPRTRDSAIIGGATRALFLVLAAALSLDLTQAIDIGVALSLHAYPQPWLTKLIRGITWLGTEPVVGGVVLLFALANLGHRRFDAYLVVLAATGGGLLALLLKQAFQRPRPVVLDPLAIVSGSHVASSHALIMLVLDGTIGHGLACRARTPREALSIWLATVGVVGLIGFSRMHLGVHYVTDVIARYALGIVWVALLVASRALLLPPDSRAPAGGLGGRAARFGAKLAGCSWWRIGRYGGSREARPGCEVIYQCAPCGMLQMTAAPSLDRSIGAVVESRPSRRQHHLPPPSDGGPTSQL